MAQVLQSLGLLNPSQQACHSNQTLGCLCNLCSRTLYCSHVQNNKQHFYLLLHTSPVQVMVVIARCCPDSVVPISKDQSFTDVIRQNIQDALVKRVSRHIPLQELFDAAKNP